MIRTKDFEKPEPVKEGMFKPDWESLKQYRVPEWFRDVKFGIWAHWGPQCQPEQGDWYARGMYQEGGGQNKWHVEHYGNPSKFGFKDVIHEWKAEKWDPDRLVALYKRVGAQYFFAMANHHDNFDLWDSKYQPWNSVKIGPEKDIIAAWEKAARKHGLRFGISVHAAHAWSWYEPSQDFDGKLTKPDGRGQWWDGFDPQDLYAQNHEPGEDFLNSHKIHSQWDWGNGASVPSMAYCEKFYNRTMDLINRYHPDLIYFDDTVLPLYPVSDLGLYITAHIYNSSMNWKKEREGKEGASARGEGRKEDGGENADAVLFGKILDEEQRKCIAWDIECGVPPTLLPFPWQTDTCIGGWHYNRPHYENNRYKTPKTVIHMLADIVSKNGNLLLNIPVRGDGSIDEKEEKILEGIAAWMDVNKECIFGTRPWKVFGEGPASDGAPISAQGFNEGKGRPFTAEDMRFTSKGNVIYVIVMGWPEKPLQIKSLGTSTKLLEKKIENIQMLGSDEKIRWVQSAEALTIDPPKNRTSDISAAFKIVLK
ncbi:MAG TPA: alpha-L-fucosidase [Lentisphaeria bacterium]|nr:MAG: alpha-L-fucosidase [Lentisphaerae bacterium GWF2_49_21]HBC88577.1 alpha-L-fucosidase [Lentisphaeria bacterium]